MLGKEGAQLTHVFGARRGCRQQHERLEPGLHGGARAEAQPQLSGQLDGGGGEVGRAEVAERAEGGLSEWAGVVSAASTVSVVSVASVVGERTRPSSLCRYRQ